MAFRPDSPEHAPYGNVAQRSTGETTFATGLDGDDFPASPRTGGGNADEMSVDRHNIGSTSDCDHPVLPLSLIHI